tara:strand:+ start:12456 stop:13508 length:1053 start_codon:yes stop_codon:yes gene_type:complete
VKLDYIIVGLGLAGLAFAEELVKAGKTFLIFEDNSQSSSLVAGGVYNPVILKRFTPVWNAKEQLEVALPFYESLEKKLKTQLDYKFSTRKVFKSIEEQNNWYLASDKPLLSDYMNPEIISEKIDAIQGDFGFGEVYQTGRIDTLSLINNYRAYLTDQNLIRYEKFEHSQINFSDNDIYYKEIVTNRIVFCEGFGIKQNPFFNYLPLNEAKGETLTIHAPALNVDFLIKSTIFVLPMGNDLYKVGATFNWTDKTSDATQEGRDELVEKLEKVIHTPYEIIDQSAGIRPTVSGRRPLVGIHPKYPKLAVLNGLGTRGVMIGPSVAKELYNFLEDQIALDSEIDCSRFKLKDE